MKALRRSSSMFLGLLMLAAGGLGHAEERTAQAAAPEALQSVSPNVDVATQGGVCGSWSETACNADHSATFTCLLGVPIGKAPMRWGNEKACAGPGYCISHHEDNGAQDDFCGNCVPGTSYCDGKVTHYCDSLGNYVTGAACKVACACGTLPNGTCKLCQ